MASLSSYLMQQTTLFRNPNGPESHWASLISECKSNQLKPLSIPRAIVAEVGYGLIIPFSIFETIFHRLAKVFSSDAHRQKEIDAKLLSSSFAIKWAFANVFMNVLCNDLITREHVARDCANSGNIFRVPSSALIP